MFPFYLFGIHVHIGWSNELNVQGHSDKPTAHQLD